MALDNGTVLENLKKQKAELEQQLEAGSLPAGFCLPKSAKKLLRGAWKVHHVALMRMPSDTCPPR